MTYSLKFLKLVLKTALVIVLFFVFLYGTILFGGSHFCYWPGAVDKGPGSPGCFYSSE